MSYTLRKIFKCDLCGKREMASMAFGVQDFSNPHWSGSNKKKKKTVYVYVQIVLTHLKICDLNNIKI